MANPRKTLITVLKFVISAALIYFVFNKLDLAQVGNILKKINPFYFTLAFLFLCVSKIIASFRLNLYFHTLKIFLTQKSNFKLYLLGMFYNLFLPGGIGGDAYKGYIIKKQFNVKTKKVVSVLVLDRLSGLLLIFIYASLLFLFLEINEFQDLKFLFVIAIFTSIAVFWYLNKKFFEYVLSIFWRSAAYSSLVQLAQLVSVFFLLKALAVEMNTIAYLLIFLVSSIVSVLPLTIGGIGSREITFFYGAAFLSLEENTSVSISMIFFLLSGLVALFGVIYHFKKPKLETIVLN